MCFTSQKSDFNLKVLFIYISLFSESGFAWCAKPAMKFQPHLHSRGMTAYVLHMYTRYAYGRYFRGGPGFAFLKIISTIIDKENNKLVLKNVCHFQSSGISPTKFVNGSVYVNLNVSRGCMCNYYHIKSHTHYG